MQYKDIKYVIIVQSSINFASYIYYRVVTNVNAYCKMQWLNAMRWLTRFIKRKKAQILDATVPKNLTLEFRY